jgi:hypothetical protein
MYIPPALIISSSAFCIYGFRTILIINRDYFLEQRQLVDLYNGEMWCSL